MTDVLTPVDVLALLSAAANDTMQLENSPSRNRVLVSVALAAARVYETIALEERVRDLEGVWLTR